jgi:hypothetical protein
MYFNGKNLKYSSSPTRHIRLFKRGGAHYSKDIVHEKIVLPSGSKVAQLSSALQHQSFRDIAHALYKINRYSSYTARTRLRQKKHTNMAKVLLGSGWMFFRCFILQRGFLDGQEGLVMAILNMHGTFARGLKQIYPDKNIRRIPQVTGDKQ